MNFISTKEFLNQPKEIQKVFIDWWEPKKYDLFQYGKFGADIVLSYDESRERAILSNEGCCYNKENIVPLLTEGQLRQFIEDKTNFKIDIIFEYIGGYEIMLYDIKGFDEYNRECVLMKHFESYGDDLLQAYWKVALEIAKESAENE